MFTFWCPEKMHFKTSMGRRNLKPSSVSTPRCACISWLKGGILLDRCRHWQEGGKTVHPLCEVWLHSAAGVCRDGCCPRKPTVTLQLGTYVVQRPGTPHHYIITLRYYFINSGGLSNLTIVLLLRRYIHLPTPSCIKENIKEDIKFS